MKINGTKVIVTVKEHIPGLTDREMRDVPVISRELRSDLYAEREREKAKIEGYFTNGQFDQWLRRQGPRAANLANEPHAGPDTLLKNFLLTETGWLLFDP